VGSVIATFEGRKGWINRLAVDPDYRGRGLGMRLLKCAEDAVMRGGAPALACLMEEGNHASIALFQKAGYRLNRDILYLSKRTDPES
jgi:ribosomal protein S18 acetylase RimI-like enzyme